MAELGSVLTWTREEAELVSELQTGSAAAFDWVVTHYHATVYNVIFRILGDSAEAADGTQEVFLKAFRGIGSFRGGSSLKTWLYRIAIREALNQRRWWRRHRRQQTSIDKEVCDGNARPDFEAPGATPFEELATREIQVLVQRALCAVPEVFRSAVILRDLEGMSYEEVAEVLGISVGTVKSRIMRGRRTLREILEPLRSPAREGTSSSVPAAWPKGHFDLRVAVKPTHEGSVAGGVK